MSDTETSPNPLTDSAAGRLVGVLISPRATFESIRQRPTWVLALVVLIFGTLATQAVIFTQVDMTEMMLEQAAAQGQDLSDDQVEAIAKYAYLGPACGTLLVPIGYAIFGLMLMIFINLAGGDIKFHGAMAIATHGTMPLVIASLLSVVVVLAGYEVDVARMQLEGGILTSNLAFLAPEGASPTVIASLAAVDVFSLWNLVLLFLGVTLVGGVGTGAGGSIVGVLWLVWIGFRVVASLFTPSGG